MAKVMDCSGLQITAADAYDRRVAQVDVMAQVSLASFQGKDPEGCANSQR